MPYASISACFLRLTHHQQCALIAPAVVEHRRSGSRSVCAGHHPEFVEALEISSDIATFVRSCEPQQGPLLPGARTHRQRMKETTPSGSGAWQSPGVVASPSKEMGAAFYPTRHGMFIRDPLDLYGPNAHVVVPAHRPSIPDILRCTTSGCAPSGPSHTCLPTRRPSRPGSPGSPPRSFTAGGEVSGSRAESRADLQNMCS